MILHNTKLFLGIFIFLAFISVAVFGLLQFNHINQSAEASMMDCPYAQNGYAVCENNLNHINIWQQFSNVTFPSLFALSFIILGLVLYFFGKQNLLNNISQGLIRLWRKKLFTRPQKIIRWLSLFINSPSRSYSA